LGKQIRGCIFTLEGTMGGGGGISLYHPTSQKRHIKNLVTPSLFRTFIFYHPTRDKGTLKQIWIPKIPVRIFRQMKKVMTIREFESWLDQMDNRLEEANKNGRPLIVEDLFVHSGK
jgi:hypothetical protein